MQCFLFCQLRGAYTPEPRHHASPVDAATFRKVWRHNGRIYKLLTKNDSEDFESMIFVA
jgi:hypothetical protein